MAKFPFGPWRPDQVQIPWDADPEPLMAEVMRSLVAAEPLRTELAEWLYCLIKNELIVVKRPKQRGRPRGDSPELRSCAIRRIQRLVATGVGVEEAIAKAKAKYKLKAGRSVVHDWLAREKASLRELEEDYAEAFRRAIVETIREQIALGATDEEAMEWAFANVYFLGARRLRRSEYVILQAKARMQLDGQIPIE